MTKIPDIIWCEIPAGEFIMGSDDGRDNEKPQHTVNIPYTYYAAKYPVTNIQYNLFVEAGGYRERRYWRATGWTEKERRKWTEPHQYRRREPFNLANHPVVGVSWHEAIAFCHWLTEKLRQHGKLVDDWLIRLPTEAEWEKAARGTDGRTYPWGEGFDPEKANGKATEVESTCAVGLFPDGVSPYGCHDMAGNVGEWCATKYDKGYKPYPYQIEDEWTEAYLADELQRNVRGGSYTRQVVVTLCCSYRELPDSRYSSSDLGFRVFYTPSFKVATMNGERNE